MENLDRMEVLKLMAHLVITVLLILVYTYLKATGQDAGDMATFISLAIGYWFGALGIGKPIKKEEATPPAPPEQKAGA